MQLSPTERLLDYVNGELLADATRRAAAETPLFEEGWIDSLKILKLIAYVELSTGRAIPDEEIVMKHFRTVETIVHHFWDGAEIGVSKSDR